MEFTRMLNVTNQVLVDQKVIDLHCIDHAMLTLEHLKAQNDIQIPVPERLQLHYAIVNEKSVGFTSRALFLSNNPRSETILSK